jgi:hypothetical protein
MTSAEFTCSSGMTFAPKSGQFSARYSPRVEFLLTGLQSKAALQLAIHEPREARPARR